MSLDLEQVMWVVGRLIYVAIGLLALWGIFCTFLLTRQIGRRRFSDPDAEEEFVTQFCELVADGNYDDAERLCAQPDYWSRAVPILAKGALDHRRMGLARLRQVVAAKFERQILADLENRSAWIGTVIKSAPMLGLLGTVVGMIGAFTKIAGVDHPNPGHLAGDISLALITTALGLVVAIPLVLAANFVQVRMRVLEDSTLEQTQVMLDGIEASMQSQRRA